jgi:Uma2 family endonuclease
MTATASIPPLAPPERLLTVDEFLRMVEVGILTEDDDVELLEGRIVTKMSRNPPHDAALLLMLQVLTRHLGVGWHVRPQAAIRTSDRAPEPDLAVVRGQVRDYAHEHPAADDVALVIEIADTSLMHDRSRKGAIYARAGIGRYWIINLRDGRIEVDSDPSGPGDSPRYRTRQDVGADGTVELKLPGGPSVPVDACQIMPG